MRNIGSRYTIDEDSIGRGASGTVYAGTDQQGNRVAVKILYPQLTHDPQVVSKFTQERRVLAGVRDPHIVNVLDLVAEGDTLAIVMEYIAGPNLHEWLKRESVVTAHTVAGLGGDIARGLAALHAADVVHCDLKPANILLATEGTSLIPKISDFGVSTILSETSESTTVMGTPRYMAPERLRHDPATTASDVYALGMVLYEIAAGVPAFSGSTQQIAKAQLELTPGRLDSVPRPLWDIIESCLLKDPASRPDAARVAAALERLLPQMDTAVPLPRYQTPPVPQAAAGGAQLTQAATPGETVALADSAPPRAAKKRSKAVPLIAAVALIAAVGGGAALWAANKDSSPQSAATPTPVPTSPPAPSPTVETVTPSVQPSVSPSTVPLATLQPQNATRWKVGGQATLSNGEEYENSMSNTGEYDEIVFKLDRKYTSMRATLGLAQNSPNGTCDFEIRDDIDNFLMKETGLSISYTDGAVPLPAISDLDLAQELTMTAECSNNATLVVGNPTLTLKPETATPSATG